jgi:hypothetical protein
VSSQEQIRTLRGRSAIFSINLWCRPANPRKTPRRGAS